MKLISAVAIQILAIALRETSKTCGINSPAPPIELYCNCTGPEIDQTFEWRGVLFLAVGTSFATGVGVTLVCGWLLIGRRDADGYNQSRRRGGGVLEIPDAR